MINHWDNNFYCETQKTMFVVVWPITLKDVMKWKKLHERNVFKVFEFSNNTFHLLQKKNLLK